MNARWTRQVLKRPGYMKNLPLDILYAYSVAEIAEWLWPVSVLKDVWSIKMFSRMHDNH